MPPDPRDAAHIWDMIEYSHLVQDLIRGVSYARYSRDRAPQLAVERAIEIVGEAARRVSSDFKEEHPEITWRGIIA